MDQTKEQDPLDSPEVLEAASAESRAEAREIIASLTGVDDAKASRPVRENPAPTSKQNIPWPEPVAKGPSTPAEEFVEFLKRTKKIWLIAGGAIFGLMALVTAMKRVSEWAANSRERRHEQAVASVTPERLIARCGQPTEDLTKDVYPILMRTMTYQLSRNHTIVAQFSRTAEEKSDWVFLSMKDEAKSYETPDAQIAAMPCLDSRK